MDIPRSHIGGIEKSPRVLGLFSIKGVCEGNPAGGKPTEMGFLQRQKSPRKRHVHFPDITEEVVCFLLPPQ